MKKRTLSILLALCMMICLVPTSVFAEGETNRKVETEQELVNALSDSSVDVITLKSDIEIGTTLIVDRNVTLDIYGYMLEISGKGSVIRIKSGAHLTIKDSDPTSTYKFTPDANGLWKWHKRHKNSARRRYLRRHGNGNGRLYARRRCVH